MSKRRPDVDDDGSHATDTTRADRWLWAARFFKTRGLAAEAVDGGKVHVNGERVKRAKQVRVGDTVAIRIGPYEHIVTVRDLSERRGPATVAATLYEETAQSLIAREKLAEQHRLSSGVVEFAAKPSKRDRRQIEDLRKRDR